MSSGLNDAESAALDHAWGWFAIHAEQRVHGINLYLIGFALVVAGYGALFELKSYALAAVVALAGIFLSAAFWLLDERNRVLVKMGERPLVELQAILAERSGIDSMNILQSVDSQSRGWRRIAKYSWIVRALTTIGFVWMVASLVFAITAAAQ
ncbi:hypothetical protein [Microbacterium sp.]|uniref:hypothetical protein n=1 Tax=Microbacterium sp. TaxID=51671 RepID=UPI003F727280